VTAQRAVPANRGGWAGGRASWTWDTLLQLLLQLLLEADGQYGEHGQHPEHRQGVPGHGLPGGGQFVEGGAGVDRHKGWRGHA